MSSALHRPTLSDTRGLPNNSKNSLHTEQHTVAAKRTGFSPDGGRNRLPLQTDVELIRREMRWKHKPPSLFYLCFGLKLNRENIN